MDFTYSIPLKSLIDEFLLEKIYVPENIDEILVHKTEVNRPGLQLHGFFDHFEPTRMQIIGRAEHKYLDMLDSESRSASLTNFFKTEPIAVIVSSDLDIFDELLEAAEYFEVPLLRTHERTSAFMAALIASLNVSLAPRITRHGVLVEVYGEGMLILGESGVGKSETAIELVKRGHRLIADDAVEIKKVSSKTLVGTAPEIIRHYVELRGIGIVDVKRIFGIGAVKMTEKIDMIVNLEPWVQGKMYDRLGLENEVTEILGIEIPTTVIPVRPGRNLAIILEIAAMNNRQKRMGYNTAVEFNKRIMGQFENIEN
ncbi:MAG: HPr(Ser) kinase/phosphatase [Ruminococcaceae bacterium]|nr:HPr(Ser) kinase/phosphatase [Oscillospiraceae bacterium]